MCMNSYQATILQCRLWKSALFAISKLNWIANQPSTNSLYSLVCALPTIPAHSDCQPPNLNQQSHYSKEKPPHSVCKNAMEEEASFFCPVSVDSIILRLPYSCSATCSHWDDMKINNKPWDCSKYFKKLKIMWLQ